MPVSSISGNTSGLSQTYFMKCFPEVKEPDFLELHKANKQTGGENNQNAAASNAVADYSALDYKAYLASITNGGLQETEQTDYLPGTWKEIYASTGLPMANDGQPPHNLISALTGAKEEDILPENWAKMRELAQQLRDGYEKNGTYDGETLNKLTLLRAFGDKKVLTDAELDQAAGHMEELSANFDLKLSAICKDLGVPDISQKLTQAASASTGEQPNLYAFLMESLFLAELEEGRQNASSAEQNPDQGADGQAAAQTPKTSNPLTDSGKVAELKKVINDLASGKADISDVPQAMASGKSSPAAQALGGGKDNNKTANAQGGNTDTPAG